MSFAIHDKTREGRRKLKEGPKAQAAYVEELQSEWIDNHATKDPAPPSRDAQVPEAVKARALRHERDIAERMGVPYDAGKQVLVEDARARAAVRDATRDAFLLAKMSWELGAIGRIRDATLAEAEKLGVALPA